MIPVAMFNLIRLHTVGASYPGFLARGDEKLAKNRHKPRHPLLSEKRSFVQCGIHLGTMSHFQMFAFMRCEEMGMITNTLFLTDRLSVRLLNIGPIEIFLHSCLVGVRGQARCKYSSQRTCERQFLKMFQVSVALRTEQHSHISMFVPCLKDKNNIQESQRTQKSTFKKVVEGSVYWDDLSHFSKFVKRMD